MLSRGGVCNKTIGNWISWTFPEIYTAESRRWLPTAVLTISCVFIGYAEYMDTHRSDRCYTFLRSPSRWPLDVQFCPSPVTAFSIVLLSGWSWAHFDGYRKQVHTWIFVSVFRRNHWGIGLSNQCFSAEFTVSSPQETHLFWRPAFARIRFVRNVFWEGCT